MKSIYYSIYSMSMSVALYAGVPITESLIVTAERTLTDDESARILEYIQDKIRDSKTAISSDWQRKLESIADAYSKAHYDDVIQQLRVLGENPEQLLHISRLRERQLNGDFKNIYVHLMVRTLAVLDWLFANDIKVHAGWWPQSIDKTRYIISLAADLKMIHERISDTTLLEETINDLKARLEDAKAGFAPKTIPGLNQAVAQLDALYACRITDQKKNCPSP